jgi:protein-export membrane protein SecD
MVALVVVWGIMTALPNALPDRARARIPTWLSAGTVSLGLDLQGGSSLLLEVDFAQVQKDRVESLVGDIRAAFRKARIPYTDIAAKGDTASVRVLDAGRIEEARTLLQGINPTLGTGVLTGGGRQYDLQVQGSVFSLHMTDAYKAQNHEQVMDQSIEVVRRRIDEMGTKEPSIERQGDDRILVQVPGLQDPAQLIKVLGTTAKMTFRLVDESADPSAPTAPPGSEILEMQNENKNAPVQKIVVQRRVMVSGDRLTDAKQDFSQTTGQPVVDFRFDSVGARQFGDVTKNNVGHRFAIVLDQKVITAPNINTVIVGGSGYIEGSFTVESAKNLAILLRAGALPAPLHIIELRTVGAELGADSIKAGRIAALSGLGLVALFMVLRYGLFGLFADVALTLNIVLLLAVLTLFGATLTLPGIAGIVLTMGMAVDANVLIYERIREEQRNGRGMLAAIDQGFRRARATIIDANATHLIASLILFELGRGPVRGFAVTLGVGILTSFFTSVMVTRLIVITWLNAARPRSLTI